MVGSLVTIYVNKHTKNDKDKEKGLLIASGLIGGDAVMGVLIALLTILGIIPATKTAFLPSYVSLAAFILLAIYLAVFSVRKAKK